MNIQPWITIYFIAACFCFLTSYSFIKGRNISKIILGHLVLTSGCWALLDGITQIVNLEVALLLQNTVLLISVFVAFLFLFFSYSFIKTFKTKTLSLLMLIPLFIGLTLSLFVDVYSNVERVHIDGLNYTHMVYNSVNFAITVSILLIPLMTGFAILAKAIKTTKEENLRKNIILFIIGMLIAIVSSYILGTGEVVYHLPPLSSVTISIGIAISSFSFKK